MSENIENNLVDLKEELVNDIKNIHNNSINKLKEKDVELVDKYNSFIKKIKQQQENLTNFLKEADLDKLDEIYENLEELEKKKEIITEQFDLIMNSFDTVVEDVAKHNIHTYLINVKTELADDVEYINSVKNDFENLIDKYKKDINVMLSKKKKLMEFENIFNKRLKKLTQIYFIVLVVLSAPLLVFMLANINDYFKII